MTQAALISALDPALSPLELFESRRARELHDLAHLLQVEDLGVGPDPERSRRLPQLVFRLLGEDIRPIPGRAAWLRAIEAAHAKIESLSPRAQAHQYRFAIASRPDGCQAFIISELQLERGASMLAVSHPIGPLLPDGSHEPLRFSLWSVHGLGQPEQAFELARELASRGFVWSPELQAECDGQSNWLFPSPAGPGLISACEAAELLSVVEPALASRGSPRV